MGSTGEPDRKRRQLSSLSPTAASAKKQHLLPVSEDKKIDIAILQYRNQKLTQKVETQKDEYLALERKYSQLKGKHQPYDSTLKAVNNTLKELARDLESCSIRTREKSCKKDVDYSYVVEDGAQSTFHEAFLKRLTERGAIETSSLCDSSNMIEGDREMAYERSKNGMCNLVSATDNLWNLKDGIHGAVFKKLSADGSFRQQSESGLDRELQSLRSAFTNVFLKHKSVSIELQTHQDADGKNKVELRRLRGELQNTADELKESNCILENLKAQRDAAKGVGFPVLNLGSKVVTVGKISNKVKDLHDMESSLKELKEQSSCHLMEIKGLHEERIKILQQMCNMQNKLKSVTCISSSQAYLLLRDQVETSKAQVFEYQSLFEKLQAEKDHLVWKERELNVKSDVVEVLRKSAATNNLKSTDLTNKIQKQIDEIKVIEAKVEEASREPGRKEIIAEFKGLVSSFPNKMGIMQSQLRRYKETASGVHSLRADVQSLTSILDRKVNACETLYGRSKGQIAERQKLQNMVQDIEENEAELKLIVEMLRRESTDSREILEARDSEYKAWANVQCLKASLDEHDLELRVKIANEAEARSQQRLAAAEAEFADMRQKLEAFKRDISRLAGLLKSKNEEIESYLSEIESIGQAYDDMQTQNQQLLQQITERDDYNIKLVLEGLRSRQIRDSLLMDKRTLEGEIQQAKLSLNFFDAKARSIEDQLKVCADQVQRLEQDKFQASMTMETTQKRFSDVKRLSRQSRDSLEESQTKVEESRMALLEQQIGLEKERFEKRRIVEELEVLRRKISRLRAQTEGSSIIEKLQQELNEYREILKCTICLERTKQVVITKCYHLFCHQCVQHIIEIRHRKCPTCSTTFGPNDVKPVYI